MNDVLDFDALNEHELGTSLFELIEFTLERTVGDSKIKGIYGINVAKVREVVRMPKINPLACSVDGIAGMFELRGVPIPAIHLAKVLGDKEADINDGQQIIVAEFSRKRAGFIVSQTNRIRRVSWDKVMPPADDAGTSINSMTLIEKNEFLFILDLERIVIDLEEKSQRKSGKNIGNAPTNDVMASQQQMPQQQMPQQQAPSFDMPDANEHAPTILLVDDSALILNSVKMSLTKIGYNVVIASNGAEAFELMENAAHEGMADEIDIVVTDVEMPRMNGLTLTKKLREMEIYKDLPILLHSSLSGNATQEQGMSVGANGYVIKNDIRYLNELLIEILGDKAIRPAS